MFIMLKTVQWFLLCPCSLNVSWRMAHDITNISRILQHELLTWQPELSNSYKVVWLDSKFKIDTTLVYQDRYVITHTKNEEENQIKNKSYVLL